MNRSLFLEELHVARREWDATLAGIPEERISNPAAEGPHASPGMTASSGHHRRQSEQEHAG